MAIPLEVIGDITGFVADAEGLIADVEGGVNIAEGAVADVEGAIADAEGALAQSEYLQQVAFWTPIIIAEFKGLVDIITGAWQLFVGVLEFLPVFVPDGIDGIFTLFTFAMSWMMCLFKNISNMQACIFYYLLEAIGQILYLPVRIWLWIAFQFKIDLYPVETRFWDFIEYIDQIVLKAAGFHISHYPRNIRDQCYNCKRLKISALVEHSTPIMTDITTVLPPALMPGLMNVVKGGTELTHPFQY